MRGGDCGEETKEGVREGTVEKGMWGGDYGKTDAERGL